MTLYSYSLRYDLGAAPNPYWGLCTLVICKPVIRRNAKCGDWVVGLGSVNSPLGDMSKAVVYAMKVTIPPKTMSEYNRFCVDELPEKIPDWQNPDFRRRVGDCIYDYSTDPPSIRESVHNESNRQTDVGGCNALVSDYFYYFDDRPVPLRTDLEPISHPSPGHKSTANEQHAWPFVAWLEGLGYEPNEIRGQPQLKAQIIDVADCRGVCAARDRTEAELDEMDEIC
jgi:hypothetical protein